MASSPSERRPSVSSYPNNSNKVNKPNTDAIGNGNGTDAGNYYHEGEAPDSDLSLSQSLNQLSISPSSPSPVRSSRSPRPRISTNPSSPLKPTPARSPSTPRPGSALRSPFYGPSGANHTPSRSATPTLLRKASMNSLHSANGVAPPRRSSSANLLSPSAVRSPRFREPESEPPKPVPTAESVANTHFQSELTAYHGANPTRDLPAETVVILQDACYGHRFSRPRTSRLTLSTIVERPERIKACAMGVSAAYVRLGDRHEDGAFPISPETNPDTLPSIPFRIYKTTRRLSLTSQTVTNVHGTKWMDELKHMCESAEAKLAKNGKELQRTAQDGDQPRQLHEGDLYLCAESLDALEGSLGGVCEAVDAVFQSQGPRRAFVAIRPPGHHCSDSHPSGFCWVNNVHVGIMHGVLGHGLTHAAILDFDLHHGDGSQSIAWQHNARTVGLPKNAALWKKSSIGYFSLHDINSYPCEQGDEDKVKNASICIDNAHGQNIWNVHLQPWKTEAEFWEFYESRYSILLDKLRSYLCSQTERLRAAGMNSKAAIFLSAGFDASEWEGAGMQRHSVNVPTDFYARIARDVVRIAAEEGTSVEGRIISVLEGGYSDRALCSGVMSHICGLAGDGPANKEPGPNGLGGEMGQRIATARGRKESSASERGARRYETSWWSASELEQLENVQAAPPSPPKPRNTGPPPTYSSPTHASTARSIAPRAVRQSSSGLPPGSSSSPPVTTGRAATPPPPDVPWTVAVHALTKLLIPSERQTGSCTHEDLNAEATRARRDRQLALSQPLPPGAASAPKDERPPTRMALRERKAKTAEQDDAEKERKNRRKTVAGTSLLATEQGSSRGGTPVLGKPPSRQAGRRLSAASTIVSENLDSIEPVPLPAPLQGPSRPDTSLTLRPESSMSVRSAHGIPPLPVKKTRGPPKKETLPKAPRAPRAVPKRQLSGADSGTSAKTSKVSPPISAAKPATKTPSPSADQAADPMDSLTSDMKKVKITLVTPAQRQARERERIAWENAKNADSITVVTPTLEETKSLELPQQSEPSLPSTRDFTTVSPASTAVNSVDLEPSPPPKREPTPQSVSSAGPPTPTPMPPAQTPLAKYPSLHPQRVPLPSSSPVPMSTPTTRSRARASPVRNMVNGNGSPTRHQSPSDMFIPYQPEGPTPATVPMQKSQQLLQWLPPNTSSTAFSTPTPTPGTVRTTRADLPVFTATSAIPFAPPMGAGRSISTESGSDKRGAFASPAKEETKGRINGVDRSLWEVAEMPQK